MTPQDTPKRKDRKNRKDIALKVRVDLLDGQPPQDGPGAAVYAFSKGGRVIARAPLGRDGAAVLPIPVPKEAMSLNVVAGPSVDDDASGLAELLRRGGARRTVRIDADAAEAEVAFEVLPNHWLCWFASRCHVPGKLVKRTELDGMKIDLPVCNATVEVYEVDPIPLIVARIPDDILERFRRWIVEPEPWPWEILLPEARRVPIPRPPRPDFGGSLALASEMDQPEAPAEAGFAGNAPASVPAELKIAAQVATLPQFRDALVRAPDLSRFLICRYFPAGVSKQLVATATTDECGNFHAVFFRGCKNPDAPDLYFKAKRHFGPFEITIYAPTPVACYTRWNYVCGTHVDLVTTHALAPTCAPCQPIEAPADDWVAVMHIGNLPLSRIRGASPNQGIIDSDTPGNEGLVFIDENEALHADTFDGRPMGGLLRPHMEFDNGLRAKGIEYYQFSWREGTTGAFQPLDHEVHRHYSYEAPGASEPTMEVYPLGPFVVGGKALFRIPPALPPKGKWVYPNLVENHTSAKFPSQTHAPAAKAGKFQLKIDLFDASGTLVDIDAAATKAIFVVPEELDLSKPATVHTKDADPLGMVVDDDGDGKRSFVLTLHIDNTACEAAIEPAKRGLLPANACGVLAYSLANISSIVSMPFTALHDNGFATYQFTLKRGVTLLGGQTIGGVSPLTNPRAAPPGDYGQTASVQTLTMAYPALGLPQCDMAAFSEAIHVWAMATNGWRRLSEYDAYDHGAFVLAPDTAP
ncbi:hypothetical protein [Aestuariicoccus sp. MJ-SS9]|uniref:hypothetical protein n=1 Tax=Aestuariicoccus sp. MJ-SS9 TaxID=3079855 RepID=UPI00290DEBA0|nr:hypothetical protein [Aestuariicoccus sp. MJ-SS9]MDU8911607.1 hypothetical protein [Aestuariicoccus sp. MJ-SS9]